MRSKVLASALALSVCSLAGAGSALAEADSLHDTLGPREVALGEALRAAPVGSTSATLNPAGVSLVRSYVIEGNVGFRPADSSKTVAASVCDSVTSRVGACAYYDFFTAEPDSGTRTSHEVGLATSLPLAERLFLGVTNKYVDYEDQIGHSHSGYLLDAGVIAKVSSFLNLAAVGYNLIGSDDMQYPKGVGTGLALFPIPTLMIAADARWNLEDEKGRYGGGIEYFVSTEGGQQGLPLRGGYVYDERTEASYATGGLGYVTTRVALDVGVRRQVSKGDETTIEFGLRFFLPN